jgi:type IV pilus assembly protein PilV
MKKHPLPHQISCGFAMIEVLVALLIMAFGMLGVASLLLNSVKANTSSIMKQQAVQIASNMVEKIRANRVEAEASGYVTSNLTTSTAPVYPNTPTVNCATATATCTPTQLATYDIWYWLSKDVAQLPLGSASVTTTTSGLNQVVTITLQWNDSPAQAKLGAAAYSATSTPHIAKQVFSTLL